MFKVVYNTCYGGFSISRKAAERLIELGLKEITTDLDEAIQCFGNKQDLSVHSRFLDEHRHHPLLIQVVEELGELANGQCAKLRIDQSDSRLYKIKEHDGKERVIWGDEQFSEWKVIL